MLTIRLSQIESFERDAMKRFRGRLAEHVARVLADHGSGASMISSDQMVDRGIPMAMGFNLRTERDIARFLTILCEAFGQIPERPLPRRALASLTAYDRNAAERLDAFEAWARQNGRNAR